MERLPNGTAMLKGLLRMSWRSLILMAVAASHEHFSRGLLRDVEQFSPFRFGFLRERRKRDIETVQIKLLIDNPGMRYVPGMIAEVYVPKEKLVKP